MNFDIIIRSPKDEEKERFYEVYQSGLPGVDLTSPKSFSNWWSSALKNGSLFQFWRVAVVENEIVGIVINSPQIALNWGMIWEIAVLPDWRGKGIGRLLILESEKIMPSAVGTLTHFALGVKIENLNALKFYERLAYGIRFLILELKGKVPQISLTDKYVVQKPASSHLSQLLSLQPLAYWSERTEEGWKRLITRPNNYAIVSKDESNLIGYAILEPDDDEQITDIDLCVLPGLGVDVLKIALNLIKTDFFIIWIQDDYQDIIEFLYGSGAKRTDCEYLLKKTVKK